jgi:hypothetical protein
LKPKPKKRYSNTQLTAAMSCGEKYRRTYIEREPRTGSSLAMKRGSALHFAAETYLKQKQAGEVLPLEKLQQVAAVSFTESIDDGVADLATDPNLEESSKMVDQFVDGWHTKVAPTIGHIELVEPYLAGIIELDGKEYELEGYPDLIDVNEDGELRVRDWKTGKTYSRGTYENGMQMAMYTLLAQSNGYDTDIVRVDHLRVLKSGVKHEHLEMTRGADHHLRLGKIVAAVDHMAEVGGFVPNPTGWMCNPTCDFWKTCPYRRPDEH